jgi:hypothetical protein
MASTGGFLKEFVSAPDDHSVRVLEQSGDKCTIGDSVQVSEHVHSQLCRVIKAVAYRWSTQERPFQTDRIVSL